MVRKLVRLVVLSMIGVAGFGISATRIASADTPVSGGCANIGYLNGNLNPGDTHSTGDQQFTGGDLVTISVSLVGTTGSARVGVKDPGGWVFYDTMPATVYYRLPSTQIGSFAVQNTNASGGPSVSVSASCDPFKLPPGFDDGRLNLDPGQPVAVYCKDGNVEVLRIIASTGHLALRVTKAAIAKIPKLPKVNTLILGEKVYGIRLYRLTSGELQVNVPPAPGQRWDYVFVWPGCDKTQ